MFSCCGIRLVSIELKFRLPDGSEIGPLGFNPDDTVARVKSSLVSNWPKDKGNRPKKVRNLNLLIGETILADNMELSELSADDPSGEILTINVVVLQTPNKNKDGSSKTNRGINLLRIELKFRLPDGTEMGHSRYTVDPTVARLKSLLVSNWPKDRGNRPKKARNLNLSIGGRILKDNMKLSELSDGDRPREILTINVVVQQTSNKNRDGSPKTNRGLCTIL